MKRSIFIAISLALLLFSQAWAEPGHVAVVKTLTNTVEIERAGSSLTAEKGLRLLNADIIHTRAESYVGVTFLDGTSITIGPYSEFRIKNYVFKPNTEKYDFAVYLKRGSALFNTGKIGKLSPESVDLSTPRATVGIRGTRFIVEVK